MSFIEKFFLFFDSIFTKAEALIDFCLDFIRRFRNRIIFPFFLPVRNFIDSIFVKYLGKGLLKERVLVRYIIKELVLYFSVAFLFFFMVFFVNQILLLAENILKKRVPFGDVILLITYCLPFVIAQSAPFATLVGFLMCLGRIMSDNEILIIRASGQSYIIVMLPVILLGIVISILSFFVNDYLLPVGTINYNRLYRQIVASNPVIEIEPNSIKQMNNATIVIGSIENNIVSDMILFDSSGNGEQRIISASDSTLVSAKKEGVLMQLNMNDANVLIIDRENQNTFQSLDAESATLNIFDSSVFGGSFGTSPREMTSYDLGRYIKNLKAYDNLSKKQLNRYIMEYNKKFSLPFGSIFFAILAIPLALIFGKHNGQTIGLIVGLVICVVYWAIMILGQIFASRNGVNGFWAMWFPNIVIGLTGLLFYLGLIKK